MDLLPGGGWHEDDPLLREEEEDLGLHPDILRAGTPITPQAVIEGADFEEGWGGMDIEPQIGITPIREGVDIGKSPIGTPATPTVLPQEAEVITPEVRVPRAPKPVPIDQNLMLDSKVIKRNLSDTSPILREIIPAPPTKKAMLRREREVQGAEHLLNQPIIEGLAPELLQLFARNMTTDIVSRDIPRLEPEEEAIPPVPLGGEDQYGATYGGGDYDEDMGEQLIGDQDVSRLEEEGYVHRAPEEVEREEIAIGGLSERTKRMHQYLDRSFGTDKEVLPYLAMIEGKKRKTVVGTFFEILVLRSKGIINVEQREPYGDINITKTAKFIEVLG